MGVAVVSKPRRSAKRGGGATAAAGGESPSKAWMGSSTKVALAAAAGLISGGTLAKKYPSTFTIGAKKVSAPNADGTTSERTEGGIDVRWPAALVLGGLGYWKGGKHSSWMTALALGLAASWAYDSVTGMSWEALKPKVAGMDDGSGEMDTGAVDDGRIYLGETDTGALSKRLANTNREIRALRARRERIEDRTQSRLESRQAAGKPLSAKQQAWLRHEQAEDRRRALRALPGPMPAFRGGGGGRPDLVTVPRAAVRPAFLAQLSG